MKILALEILGSFREATTRVSMMSGSRRKDCFLRRYAGERVHQASENYRFPGLEESEVVQDSAAMEHITLNHLQCHMLPIREEGAYGSVISGEGGQVAVTKYRRKGSGCVSIPVAHHS